MIKRIAILTGLLFVGVTASAGAATPPSLYTAPQAAAGAAVYAQSCAMCHGAQLQGESAPALTGERMTGKHHTLGKIFSITAKKMPAGQPGSLSHTEYEDVMAYILSKNGFPAGSSALTDNAGLTSSVSLYRAK
jgi:mono/diheme cytochrome c family protein